MKKIFLIFLFILFIVVGFFFFIKGKNHQENLVEETRLDRQEIMQDVAGRISDISPIKPVLGGSWYANRFWFVKDSNENFYVEYEDGHIARQILLKAEIQQDKLKYKVIGYFEPGETAWVLKKGENPFLDRGLDLYEHEEELGRWIKRN